MNSTSPPLKRNDSERSAASSSNTISMPEHRKASSRRWRTSRSGWNSRTLKILESGLKLTMVPVFWVLPIAASGASGTPREKFCSQTVPSRWISSRSHSDRKLTTLTPTPCSPPDTL